MCAQYATLSVPIVLPKLQYPFMNCCAIQIPENKIAGTRNEVNKNNTNTLIFEVGNITKYAPKQAEIAPEAPMLGTTLPILKYTCVNEATTPPIK